MEALTVVKQLDVFGYLSDSLLASLEAVYQALRRRLLVAKEGGQWRLRVPLMQRWLRERG